MKRSKKADAKHPPQKFLQLLGEFVNRYYKRKSIFAEYDPHETDEAVRHFNFCHGLAQMYGTWSVKQINEFIELVTGKDYAYDIIELVEAHDHVKRIIQSNLGIKQLERRYKLAPHVEKIVARDWVNIRETFSKEEDDMPLKKPTAKKKTTKAPAKKAPAKKAPAKKAPAKKATGAKRGRPSRCPEDLVGMKITANDNPARKGTVRHALMACIGRCASVEAALGKTYTYEGEERKVAAIDIRVAQKIGAITLK